MLQMNNHRDYLENASVSGNTAYRTDLGEKKNLYRQRRGGICVRHGRGTFR